MASAQALFCVCMPDDSILILYKSKYGSTKQYAEWLGASLSAPVKSVDEAGEQDLLHAKTVAIGGCVRVGKIMCAPFVKRHWNMLKNKRIILFSVSGTPPEKPEVMQYFEGSFPADVRSSVRFFPLPGRHGPLNLGDRIMMWFPLTFLRLRMRFAKTPEARNATAEDYRQMSEPSDHVDRQRLAPILAAVTDVK